MVINKILAGNKRSVYVTREELEEVFSNSPSEKEKKYIIYLDNESMNMGELNPLESEEKIYNSVKSQITKNIAEFKNYYYPSMVGWYLYHNPLFLDFVKQSIQDFDLNKMKFNIELMGGKAIILKSNGSDMTMQYVSANFVNLNNYKIDIVDIPINKYTLKQLNESSKIMKTKETRIPLKLNPDISKEDIKEAKKMVKSLK